MPGDDQRTVALAMEARERHGVTIDGTCHHCLPPGTPWPCLPFQLAAATIEQLATPAPTAHPDWLNGHD
jgi:hypothetical protein